MPYIRKARRRELLSGRRHKIKTPGELNYAFHTNITSFLESEGTDYQRLNDVIGALECAKLEVYRRLVIPYEDKKIKENGDCAPYEQGHLCNKCGWFKE